MRSVIYLGCQENPFTGRTTFTEVENSPVAACSERKSEKIKPKLLNLLLFSNFWRQRPDEGVDAENSKIIINLSDSALFSQLFFLNMLLRENFLLLSVFQLLKQLSFSKKRLISIIKSIQSQLLQLMSSYSRNNVVQ